MLLPTPSVPLPTAFCHCLLPTAFRLLSPIFWFMFSGMIKTFLLAFALLLVFVTTAFAVPRTMRLDYYHTGNAKQEHFSVDRVVLEPLPWPGDLTKSIDSSNLGKYIFEIRDKTSGRVLYSRGFASIYGEWETTDEATTMNRTFSESLRFPAPDAPVEIVLKKRDRKNNWDKIWTTSVDPKDILSIVQSPRRRPD